MLCFVIYMKFGGCTLRLAENDDVEAFMENVGRIYTEKIGYSPTFYVTDAGDGAEFSEKRRYMQIREAIIVEGIYDKIHLDSMVEALVVPTYGFSIFTDRERLAYISALAEKTGIIILMDSDSAGFKIRAFLHEHIPQEYIRDTYIPAVSGKEKRKKRPSAEGTLGVEGISRETLLEILETVSTSRTPCAEKITDLDFYRDGLLGGANSRDMRAALAKQLSLPPTLSKKALLAATNALMTKAEYTAWRATL